MRNLCLLLCALLPGLFASGLLFAESPSHAHLSLFGVPFPQNGAHVLLAVDSSEAMNTPFPTGLPNETRWQAVRRSVRRLAADMAGQAAGRHVFRITVLFCGGSSYHRGSEQIWIRNPRDTERLMSVFSDRIVGGRRNTGNVLRNELWSLAARDGITDICLVDCPPQKTEPSSPNNPLYTVEDWYTLTPDTPITSRRRQEIRNAKLAWFATWRHPNPRRGRRKTHPMPPPPRSGIRFSCVTFGGDTPDYRKIAELGRGVCTVPDRPAEANEQQTAADILADRCAPLPPRTEEVSISAIAIGEKSVFLKELAKHCNGRYIERISDSTPALNTPGNTQP